MGEGTEAVDVEVPAPLATRYRSLRVLGAGGFGDVLLCQDLELGTQVALKLLRAAMVSPELRARFTREARVTAGLTHPNIVKVLAAGDLGDEGAYIVYEYVEGDTLAARAGAESIPVERVVAWGQALAEALAEAHAAGVVHRDVKPENVLLRAGDEPVLCDFGIAHREQGHTVQTEEGMVLGTPATMAPEVLQGMSPSPASDQYGLAATLYRVAYGVYPRGEDLAEVLRSFRSLVAVEAPRRSGDPAGLRGALGRALAVDPAARFPDVRSFGEALARAEGQVASPATTRMLEAPLTRDRSPASRLAGPRLVAVGLATVLALGMAILRRSPHPPATAGALSTTSGSADAAAADAAAEAANELDLAIETLRELVPIVGHPPRLRSPAGRLPSAELMLREGRQQVADAGLRVAAGLAAWLRALDRAHPGEAARRAALLVPEARTRVVEGVGVTLNRTLEKLRYLGKEILQRGSLLQSFEPGREVGEIEHALDSALLEQEARWGRLPPVLLILRGHALRYRHRSSSGKLLRTLVRVFRETSGAEHRLVGIAYRQMLRVHGRRACSNDLDALDPVEVAGDLGEFCREVSAQAFGPDSRDRANAVITAFDSALDVVERCPVSLAELHLLEPLEAALASCEGMSPPAAPTDQDFGEPPLRLARRLRALEDVPDSLVERMAEFEGGAGPAAAP